MERLTDIDSNDLLVQRTRHLTESLTKMRTAEFADVILVCDGKELYAHKLILQASSEYFITMFSKVKTGSVVCKELDYETLDIILDFIYLGTVEKMKTVGQVKNVLKAARLMQLHDLDHYCCNRLDVTAAATENSVDRSSKYKSENFANIWAVHEQELLSDEQFCLLSVDQLTDIILVLKEHSMQMDNILFGIMSWVKYDFENRASFAVSLLYLIDFWLVTKPCFLKLVQSQNLLAMPKDFIKKVMEFVVVVLLHRNEISLPNLVLVDTESCGKARIIFFSRQRNVEIFCQSKSSYLVTQPEARDSYQQLDLVTMSWLQVYDIKTEFCINSVCEYDQKLYMVENSHVEMYDPQDQSYLDCGEIKGRYHPVICHFKENLYVIGFYSVRYWGGEQQYGETEYYSEIFYSKPGTKEWQSAVPLRHGVYPVTILNSQSHLYVLDNTNSEEIIIQYNSSPNERVAWKDACVSSEGGRLKTANFFIFENTIHALYLSSGNTIHLAYCHKEETMKFKMFPKHPKGLTQISRICVCGTGQRDVLYVSTEHDTFRIPNYTWDPQTARWHKLPFPSGHCKIPNAKISLVMS